MRKRYSKIVEEAREQAKQVGVSITVYQIGERYDWCSTEAYHLILEASEKPVIRLLLCLPDGTVAQ